MPLKHAQTSVGRPEFRQQDRLCRGVGAGGGSCPVLHTDQARPLWLRDWRQRCQEHFGRPQTAQVLALCFRRRANQSRLHEHSLHLGPARAFRRTRHSRRLALPHAWLLQAWSRGRRGPQAHAAGQPGAGRPRFEPERHHGNRAGAYCNRPRRESQVRKRMQHDPDLAQLAVLRGLRRRCDARGGHAQVQQSSSAA